MANRIKYGLKNCYYAKVTFSEDGDPIFDDPVAMPGARSLSLDYGGDQENYYADDVVWTVLFSSTSYEGSLEVVVLPESFYTDILHEELDSNGVLAENADVEPEHFALMFELSADQKKIRHVFYNCTCPHPSIESSTVEDSKEPQTDTLEITASPLANGYVKAKTSLTTSDEVYNSWFEKVYVPADDDDTEPKG